MKHSGVHSVAIWGGAAWLQVAFTLDGNFFAFLVNFLLDQQR